MARKKISEFKAKSLLLDALALPNEAMSFGSSSDFSSIEKLDTSKSYVSKVDEGVKKRMKNGLVALNKKPSELKKEIGKLQSKGYAHFIVEPFIKYDQQSEMYLSFERVREGLRVMYSVRGGINIEDNKEHLRKKVVDKVADLKDVAVHLGLKETVLAKIVEVFDKYYFSFLKN